MPAQPHPALRLAPTCADTHIHQAHSLSFRPGASSEGHHRSSGLRCALYAVRSTQYTMEAEGGWFMQPVSRR